MCTVLVVDDDPEVRELITSAVVISGHKSIEADGAVAALEKCEIRTPDVLTVDLKMPLVDGIDTLRQLRDAGVSSFAIVVSGQCDKYREELKATWQELRIFDVLQKPVAVDTLIDRIESAAEATKKESELCDLLEEYVGKAASA